MAWRIELCFRRPSEYGCVNEYDIYALFTQRARSLPLLKEFDRIEAADPGLVKIKDQTAVSFWAGDLDRAGGDVFGIVVRGASKAKDRSGWLRVNPSKMFKEFVAFKRDHLAQIRGGREKINPSRHADW